MTTILCVEDEPTQLVLLKIAFQRAGFTVVSAENGAEAIDVAMAQEPDFILMDLMMPIMDGATATQKIKMIPSLAHIPIIIYTAYDKENMIDRAIAAGALDVILKTTQPKALIAKINEVLDL